MLSLEGLLPFTRGACRGVAPLRAVLLGSIAAASSLIFAGAAPAHEVRPSVTLCEASTTSAATPGSSFTLGSTAHCYSLSLRAGDIIHLRELGGATTSVDGGLYFASPAPDTNSLGLCPLVGLAGALLTGSNFNIDCTAPRTGSYLLHNEGGHDPVQVSLTVTHHAVVTGSCQIGRAPRIALTVLNLGAGYLCGGGRQFFRLQASRPHERLVITWNFQQYMGDYENYCDHPGGVCKIALYPPHTDIFSIERRKPFCGNYNDSGFVTTTCTLSAAGSWLVAIGRGTTWFSIRLHH